VDRDSLYWTLSTLPQVSAAYIAFVGFLALESLKEPLRRQAEMENLTRRQLLDWLNLPPLGALVIGMFPTFQEVRSTPGDDLMEKIGHLLKDQKIPQMAAFDEYYLVWIGANNWIRRQRGLFSVFIIINLAICLISLSLLPNVRALEGTRPGCFALAVMLAALFMILSTGWMVYHVVTRPRF